MDVVISKLKLGLTKEAKDLLDSSKEILNNINSTETLAFSSYYFALLDYYKLVGPQNEFYKTGLLYLAYTPTQSIPEGKPFVLATDMALAAILGRDIFNFGEVIATPILSSLKGTCNSWLHDLIFALNEGDVQTFESIVVTHRDNYFANSDLASNHEVTKQKAMLLSLINIAFERPSHDRIIDFAYIAKRTAIPVDQVEWLVMRAISLGLVKGSMDEVAQTVTVTWVQPRVLDIAQLSMLNTQIDSWRERVRVAMVTVDDQSSELFV